MWHVIFFLVVLSPLLTTNAQRNCDQIGVLFYEDIGCTPIYGNETDCPLRFDCDLGVRNGSCFFRNTYYSPGEQIPNEELDEVCHTDCFCQEDGNFECAEINCEHHFNTNAPGCYWEFSMDKCCSIGEYCPEEEHYCEISNNRVMEGQIYTPPHTCYRCLCQQVFNETYDEAYCKRISCGTQARYSQQLERGCAPTYNIIVHPDHQSMCCPTNWYCPEDMPDDGDDGDDDGDDDDEEDPDLMCEFGSKKYKIGEWFNDFSSMFISCTCRIPPLMSCTRY